MKACLPASFVGSLPPLDGAGRAICADLDRLIRQEDFPFSFEVEPVVKALQRMAKDAGCEGGVAELVDRIDAARLGNGGPVEALAQRYEETKKNSGLGVVCGSTVAPLATQGHVVLSSQRYEVPLGVAYLYVDWVAVHACAFDQAIEVLRKIVAVLWFSNQDWGATWSRVLLNFEHAVGEARTSGEDKVVFAAHVGTTTNVGGRRWAKLKKKKSLRERVLQGLLDGVGPSGATFEMRVFGRVADLPIYACAPFVESLEVALQMKCQLVRNFGEGGSGTYFGSEKEKIHSGDFKFINLDQLPEHLADFPRQPALQDERARRAANPPPTVPDHIVDAMLAKAVVCGPRARWSTVAQSAGVPEADVAAFAMVFKRFNDQRRTAKSRNEPSFPVLDEFCPPFSTDGAVRSRRSAWLAALKHREAAS